MRFSNCILIAAIGVSRLTAAVPELTDDRLEVHLFAENPQIITPIGLAVDEQDRIYVLESHTHTPPPGYQGPDGDIVKVFSDADYDGKPDGEPKSFTEGINAGMNLGFSGEGTLYICAAWEVIALPDANEDGHADEKKTILRLETNSNYPHSAQLGIAFSKDDWIYISRGNQGGSTWTVYGTDGSSVSGNGTQGGGSVYRCRLDGSQVQAVATGFWNSMNLKFDLQGRLLLVDNDPDARGPNRLVHVVEQGDYGYKSRFGGGGNHPFQGWDGSLPGTLGYVDSIGEAPCDLIDLGRTSFPLDYRDQLLITVWNENKISHYIPEPKGVSITATHSLWMQGDQDFRPVAMEADSHGNLYVTDWASVAYPNHGKGRIWRISAKENDGMTPKGYFDIPESTPGVADFVSLISTRETDDLPRLELALTSEDPFLRHAGVVALSQPEFQDSLNDLSTHVDAEIRLGALLAMRKSGFPNTDHLQRFLGDPDESVRRAALMWVGEERLGKFREDVERAIRFDDISVTIFESYLAAITELPPPNGEQLPARRGRGGPGPRNVDAEALIPMVRDERQSDQVRALAIIHLENPDAPETLTLLRNLALSSAPVIQREAIRSLTETSVDSRELLLGIAKDTQQTDNVRAEALLGLSRKRVESPATLLSLIDDPSEAVQQETLRTLRFYVGNDTLKQELMRRYDSMKGSLNDQEMEEQFEFIFKLSGEPVVQSEERPETVEAWQELLSDGGDILAGERVFFSLQSQCSNCHLMNNRGRRIGPELSNIGQSVSREQIIHSIVRPSDQFSPDSQAWFVELKDGSYFQGLQLDHKANGAINLFTTEGITRHFDGPEIENYGVLPRSLMPDGLDQLMTVGELRNLVAFLESRR